MARPWWNIKWNLIFIKNLSQVSRYREQLKETCIHFLLVQIWRRAYHLSLFAWVHIRRKVFAKYFALNQRFQKHQKFLRRKNKSLTNIFTRIIPRVFTQIFIRIVIQNCFDGTGSIERIACVASNVIMTIPWVSPVTIFSTFTKCL